MTDSRDRLLRRRLLLLRWAVDTRDEAQRLARDLDPAHPVTQNLRDIVAACSRLEEMLQQPTEI